MTVVWSRSPNSSPMAWKEVSVHCRMRYIASPRDRTTLALRIGPRIDSSVCCVSLATALAISRGVGMEELCVSARFSMTFAEVFASWFVDDIR